MGFLVRCSLEVKAKSNNCCPGVLGAHALPEPRCHGVIHDDRSLHQPDRTSTHLQVLPTPPSIHVPTRTSRPCPSRRPSVRTMRIRPVDLPAPPVPPHYAQDLVQCLDQPLLSVLYLSLSVRHLHLFSGTTSKIKNFSLIPSSSYYLPKIPITAVL